MKKYLFFTLILLVFSLSEGGFAQDGNLPHISQLRAEVRNNLIRLTWVDSPEARGMVYIFRSTRPFGSAIPVNIRPVIVRYGEQQYIDDIDDLDNLYYFIAASDTSGRRFEVIIPQINTTNVNLALLSQPSSGQQPAVTEQAQAQVQVPVPVVPQRIQGISNLKAVLDGDIVVISFDVLGAKKNAVLYRSIQPVRRPADLRNAVIVQTGFDSPFIDLPVPGLSWYYTLVFEDEISAGSINIRPGVNTTLSPVTIASSSAILGLQEDSSEERHLRPIPLPIMTLGSTVNERYILSDFSRQIPLSEDTERMLNNSGLPAREPPNVRTPRIFTIDLQAPAGGEDSALFQIVSEHFVKRDWEGASSYLEQYLSLPRSGDVEARARFYLGQALYFTGDYKAALFEFLSIKSRHPVEANSWIDTILEAMIN